MTAARYGYNAINMKQNCRKSNKTKIRVSPTDTVCPTLLFPRNTLRVVFVQAIPFREIRMLHSTFCVLTKLVVKLQEQSETHIALNRNDVIYTFL